MNKEGRHGHPGGLEMPAKEKRTSEGKAALAAEPTLATKAIPELLGIIKASLEKIEPLSNLTVSSRPLAVSHPACLGRRRPEMVQKAQNTHSLCRASRKGVGRVWTDSLRHQGADLGRRGRELPAGDDGVPTERGPCRGIPLRTARGAG